MKTNFTKLAFSLLLTFFAAVGWGQTNPGVLHNLSTGSWTLTGWNSDVAAGRYPGNGATGANTTTGVVIGVANANMMFWTGAENPALPALPTGNYAGNYSATSASRINGLGTNGFSMVMTGSAGQGRPNSAVLALNATGRQNIAVQWTAGTVAQSSGSPTPREHRIRLQYKIGVAGAWTDVPGPIEYTSAGKAAGHAQNMGNTTLPAACNNQAILYVRWVYYQHAANNGGSRAQLRIDDITVSSSPTGCAAPTTQASQITFANVVTTSMDLNWTNGNGAGRVVIMNTSNTFTAPTNGSNPTANTTYSGSGQQVIYNSTSNSVSITGLSSSTTYWFRVYEYCSPDRTYQTATATNNPNSQAISAPSGPTITTSAISGSPFCVGNTVTASVSVPFTVTGTFNSGNVFTAQLSNASGSFASPTNIGTLTQTTAGTISATIPASIAAGTGYRIRVIGSNPSTTGADNGTNLTIQNFAAPTAVSSTCGNLNASVGWTNPGCFDQVLVVAKNGAFTTALPTGDGSAYTANLAFGSGTGFDDGFVVYKGTGTASGTITSLSATNHSFKVFARKGTTWVASSVDNCTPTNTCATEDFTNMPANNTSYTSRTWTGTNSVIWTAAGASTNETINSSRALTFGPNSAGTRNVTSPSYSGGMGILTFDYVRAFTNSNTRNLQVWVNGVQQGGNISVSTSSDVVQTYNQTLNIDGPVVLEIRSINDGQVKIDNISWTCYNAPCFTPSTHATSVTVPNITVTTTDATINWTNGNGNQRIVLLRAASDVNANPANNSTYTANATFGSGSQIGTGNFVIYKGTGSSVTVEGLTPGTVYYAKIFEFACAPGSEEYFTTGTPGNTNFFTEPAVPINFNSICLNQTSVDLAWEAPIGDFDGYMLVGRIGTNELSIASITDPATQSNNLDFSSAPTYSTNGKILYIGNNTTATVTGLTNATDYTFRVYTYKKVGSVNKFSTSTAITRTTGLNNVTNASGVALNQGAFVSWTNPNNTCFDEVLVVVNTTAGIDFTPTGNGSAYTANPAYAGVNSIVYKGDDPSSVDVSNLVNGDTYYFEIFVRKGTTWSTGVEVSVVPADVTILNAGDVAIIAVNTAYLSSGGDDEVCFIAFKDIKPGTSIEFTDNGYERVNAGQWGNTEGTIRMTYNGASDILAGTPICIQGSGYQSSDFDVQLCGDNDNANWSISSLNGNFSSSFDLNASDQIWILQNGTWNAGQKSPALHNATYTGNVVWGWTATGWEAAPNYASTSGSTLLEGTECFNIDLNGKTNPDKIKYTGPLTSANQSVWITRINNPANWTGYSSNANYNGVTGRNYSGACVTFPIASGGFQAGKWTGATDTDWFKCSNWDDLRVPTKSVDVLIPNVTTKPLIGNGTAECKNVTIQASSNLTMNNAASILEVYGNWSNNSGGNLNLQGNNNATVKFRSGGTQTIGGSNETYFQRLIIENGTLVNLDVNTRVGGNGLLQVTGVGSQLGATHSANNQRRLNIQGNTTFQLVSGGTMNDNALDHLNILTGGNSSLASLISNGNPIKCWNFEPVKTTSSGVTLTANTPLICKNNFDANFEGTAVFTDNGNTITVGDDIRLAGNAPERYNFTGTFIMNGEGSGATNTIQNGTDSAVGHINNLIIETPVSKPNVQINPQTGSQTTTIKGDFTINSGNINFHGNTVRIGGNWVNNVGESAFIENTSTVEFNGSGTQNITTTGGEEFYGLSLNKTAGEILNLNSNIEVSNTLIFDGGIIQTNANTLFVSNSSPSAIINGAIAGTDNYVEGRLNWATDAASYIFPVGHTTHGAQGFNIDVTGSGNVLGFLETNSSTPIYANAYCDLETSPAAGTEVGDGNTGTDGILDRVTFNLASPLQWNITNPLGGVTNFDLVVYANGGQDIAPVVSANGTPVRYLMKNGEPGNAGVTTSTGAPSFSTVGLLACPNQYALTRLTSFSLFTIDGATKSNTLLPVEMLYFTARGVNNEYIKLEWATATEINNEGFEIEKSTDGVNFEKIGFIAGAGNYAGKLDYNSDDFEVQTGIVYYYRLKQIDFDGQFEYSKIVSASLKNGNNWINIYPVPANDNVVVESSETIISSKIFDVAGRKIIAETTNLSENKLSISINHLANGVYYLKIQTASGKQTLKFIKE